MKPDLARGKRTKEPVTRTDHLPPHDAEIERAALGCVILAGTAGSQAQVDALLIQLRPALFYDTRTRLVHDAAAKLRMEGNAVDLVTLTSALTRNGMEARDASGLVSAIANASPSTFNFPTYLDALKQLWLRRWTLAKSAEFAELAGREDLPIEDLQRRFGELNEVAGRIGTGTLERIPIVTWQAIEAFVPDPKSYLIGDNIISYGDVFCLAGWQGLGKSRLLNTLAFAGAKGTGRWMGYDVRRKFRTLVLITETEGSVKRLKQEIAGLPASYAQSVEFSICRLNFADPGFRDELRRHFERTGFDMLLVDHWSDVARDEGKADYQEAFDSVMSALPRADKRPAVGFAVHMRKLRGGESWIPKIGRALLSEIMGASYISQKARTVFAIQAATMDLEDDRVVFEVAKCNDGEPEPRSAWHRRNGAFEPVADFDFDGWMNPEQDGGQRGRGRGVKLEDLANVFEGGRRRLARKQAVEALMEAGASQASAYRALKPDGPFAANVVEDDGLLCFVP